MANDAPEDQEITPSEPPAPRPPDPEFTEASEYEHLLKLHSLYSNIQVNLESVYYQRTSIVTLTQGLLFVAYNGIIDNPEIRAVSIAVGVLGALLAVMWIFFEQRNHIFFKGRAILIRSLEAEIEARSGDKFKFFGLWTSVPKWVKENAKWYEAASAQSILRFWVPLLFAVIWAGVVYMEVQEFIDPDADVPDQSEAVEGDDASNVTNASGLQGEDGAVTQVEELEDETETEILPATDKE